MNTKKVICLVFAAGCGVVAFSSSYYLLGFLLEPEAIKKLIIKYFGS